MTEQVSGYKAVKRIAIERPDWLPIIRECLNVSLQTNNDFAGSWVFQHAQKRGLRFSNLRLLVSFGILKKEGTSRSGRRAYYSIVDAQGVEQALKELGQN